MTTTEPSASRPRNFFDRLAAVFHDDEVNDREAFRQTLLEAHEHKLFDQETFSMMEGAMNVSELRVHEIMVPRSQIFAIDLAEAPAVTLRRVVESGHSRFPAYEGDLDNVQGILHAKDLLRLEVEGSSDMKSCLRSVRFIPESQPANQLLHDFRETRSHMALVIDEFGGISGLITIEDVLEQIVGDISDEFDDEAKAANIMPDGTRWRVRALTTIDEFNEYFHSELEDSHCETIGGLVTDRFEHVPHVGETIEEKNFRFKVLRADQRQAVLFSVEKLSR